VSEKIAKQIRDTVIELFKNDEIDIFIGFQNASIPLKSRPVFIKKPENPIEDADDILKITWDSFCSNNISVYLPKYYEKNPRRKEEPPKPRIAIAAKGCDYRSIVTLLKEKQVPRDHLKVIGIPCRGMVDTRKVLEKLYGSLSENTPSDNNGTSEKVADIVAEYKEDGDTIEIVDSKGNTHSFSREEVLQDACLECRFPKPEGTDYLVDAEAREPASGRYEQIEEFEKQSREERWQFFKEEISRCIRCNACRQACPTCYCKECFAEQTDLHWIGATTEFTDTMFFHLVRIFHQAGRCVQCDACYRACPMGIDLKMLTRKIGKDVEELFSYVPNFSEEELPPLSTFKTEDDENFISEP
jgi:ferredoxin